LALLTTNISAIMAASMLYFILDRVGEGKLTEALFVCIFAFDVVTSRKLEAEKEKKRKGKDLVDSQYIFSQIALFTLVVLVL
jgi:hypothetical protein